MRLFAPGYDMALLLVDSWLGVGEATRPTDDTRLFVGVFNVLGTERRGIDRSAVLAVDVLDTDMKLALRRTDCCAASSGDNFAGPVPVLVMPCAEPLCGRDRTRDERDVPDDTEA